MRSISPSTSIGLSSPFYIHHISTGRTIHTIDDHHMSHSLTLSLSTWKSSFFASMCAASVMSAVTHLRISTLSSLHKRSELTDVPWPRVAGTYNPSLFRSRFSRNSALVCSAQSGCFPLSSGDAGMYTATHTTHTREKEEGDGCSSNIDNLLSYPCIQRS